MRSVAPLLVLTALFAFGACAGPADSVPEKGTAAGRASSREPYTRTRAIDVDGEARGYLVSYDPIPIHALGEVERSLPSGSHRILDGAFHDVGFLTPEYEVFRHEDLGEVRSLGVAKSIEAGLARFFQGTSAVLSPLSAGGQPD